jgi:hypothetical protein
MNNAAALIPHEPLPGKCNARKRQGEGLCKPAAGAKTDHPGYGRGYLHGGAALTKSTTHGLTSRYLHVQLQAQIDKYLADPDPSNLLPELAFLRACLQRYLDLHPEITDTELLAAGDSVTVRDTIRTAVKIVDAIARTVGKIESIRAANAIGIPDLTRMLDYFLETAAEFIPDEAALAEYRRRCGLFRWSSGAGKGTL